MVTKKLSRWSGAVGLCALTACAPDLRLSHPFDGELPPGDYAFHKALGAGVVETTVDATRKEAWIYFDLDTRNVLPASDAVGMPEWDLAFQRFKIITNSGVDGTGTVSVAILPNTDFDAVQTAPDTGYLQDAPDGPDDNTDVDSAFLVGDGWYSYSLFSHGVSPRERIVYVVRSSEQVAYALTFVAYYDQAGTSGKPTFRWKRL